MKTSERAGGEASTARSARIAVTGIGVIAPQAIGIEAFSALLAEGRSAIREVDRFDAEGLRARKAALVADFKGRDFIAPMKMRRMNVLSRWAVAASKLALSDAGREAAALDSTGVALGTAFGPVQTSVEYMQEYVEKGAALAPPQLFAESVANAPGSHVAIEHGFRGFNVTITQRESSALSAAMYASSQLLKGIAASALTGGVDEVNEMLYSVLDRIGALAHAENGVEEKSRPFDRDRNGLVLGEGGSILLLEREPRSEPYGFFSGFGIARDTSAPLSDWGEGAKSVAAAMRLAIEDAGLGVEEIDAVYASANSTLRGDRLEARALQELFGDRRPPVVATKGVFGEYAAGGALQLVSAFLALRQQQLHPSVGFERSDEGVELNIVTERRAQPLRHLLVNSLSAGGGIISAVVSR